MGTRIATATSRTGRGRGRWLAPVAVIAALGISGIGTGTARAQDGASLTLPVGAPVAQTLPSTGPSITVTGTGTATAPAETVRLQIVVGTGFNEGAFIVSEGAAMPEPAQSGDAPTTEDGTPVADDNGQQAPAGKIPGMEGMGAPPRLTEDDLQPVVDAMVAAQVDAAAIEVVIPPGGGNGGYGGPSGGFVEATIEAPTQEGLAAIVEAADEAAVANGLSLFNVAAAYDLADCSDLIREARVEAIADARAQAAELADLLEVELGEMIQAYDYSFGGYDPMMGGAEGGCAGRANSFGGGGASFGPGLNVTLPTYDPSQPAEVRVSTGIGMVFAIGEAP